MNRNSSSLEKKAPSACKNAEAKRSADNEKQKSRGSCVNESGAVPRKHEGDMVMEYPCRDSLCNTSLT